jgi:hypothetical protein
MRDVSLVLTPRTSGKYDRSNVSAQTLTLSRHQVKNKLAIFSENGAHMIYNYLRTWHQYAEVSIAHSHNFTYALARMAPHSLVLAKSSDNNESALSAGSDCDGNENPTDQDSVGFCSEGLVPSDWSHLGFVSADSIYPDCVVDPLADGLLDQAQQ